MDSIKANVSVTIMGIIGILFIVIGFQGALGKVLACLLEPSLVVDKSNG